MNTGEVVLENLSSQKRAQYTVISSHVNLAAQIESYTVGGQKTATPSPLGVYAFLNALRQPG